MTDSQDFGAHRRHWLEVAHQRAQTVTPALRNAVLFTDGGSGHILAAIEATDLAVDAIRKAQTFHGGARG